MTETENTIEKTLVVVPERLSPPRHLLEQAELHIESVVTRREFGSAVRAYVSGRSRRVEARSV
jgi:hypothetical protein